jgi:hypothetical protein
MNHQITKDKVKSKIHSPDAIPSFIRKTYDILEERKFPEVIDWNAEGTAIVIKKPSEFCQKVLPTYFKHNNLTSFVRQLNMYNFHKRRTQNVDHVYYHDLFQRGKRYLLKEIKRKNHEHGSDKSQKSSEGLDTPQAGKDFSSLIYENQFLKRLYNEAMTKIAMLEGQVKDLSTQSQSLWAQLCQKSECEKALKPMLATFGKQTSELTQEQLPMTFGKIMFPQINLGVERQPSMQQPNLLIKSNMNVNHFFNLGQDSDSTEVSHTSPSLQPSMDSEKCFDFSDPTPLYQEASGQPLQSLQISQFPSFPFFPQMSERQCSKSNGELLVSRQEKSVGQMLETWNFDAQSNEGLCFADQKTEVQAPVLQSISQETNTVLGKRPLDIENQGCGGSMKFHFPEPMMKRPHEFSVFNRRMYSTGAEDKDLLRTSLRRDSSVNEEYDSNVAIDLMDFNHSFYA